MKTTSQSVTLNGAENVAAVVNHTTNGVVKNNTVMNGEKIPDLDRGKLERKAKLVSLINRQATALSMLIDD